MTYLFAWTGHTLLLPYFARVLRPDVYVELGTESGENCRNVAQWAKRAIGVDIQTPEVTGFEFYHMTTDAFAAEAKRLELRIDMLFIDAGHTHENSMRDFENFFPLVVDNGLIFMHDTYPANETFIHPGLSGDVYRTAWAIRRQYHEQAEMVTLPFCPGLSIIRKCTRQLDWMP